MNEPVQFKRLGEIAANLHERLNALQLGQLGKEQLEELTEQSRELYERLVVLRFKAYDGEIKTKDAPASEKTEVVTETPKPSAINFRISETKTEVSPNQVSLIDAIEEVTKAAPEVPKEVERPVVVQNNVAVESIAEKLAKSLPASESLAQKLENTPIADLKKAITLNQRFQFSKELFKGNNQDYEVTIDRLNNTSREEALKTLDSLRSKYAWNNESPVTLDFMELIERRFPR